MTTPRRIANVAIVLAGAMCLSAVSRAADDQQGPDIASNVLLVTIDTLRPDALGFIGGVNETPAIDRLANEGRSFAAAVTPVPLTLPAHSTIMTGLDPQRHGIRDNGRMVNADLVTLAELMRDSGWSTAAFVGGFPLEAAFGLDQGFEHYDDQFSEGKEGWLERRAADTTDAAVKWIRTAREPWFVWVHYYDPHDPYDPPRTFWQPGPRGAYLGEVAYTDFAIERLVDALPKTSRNRLTVVTADHGEALGEHREKRHGFFVYDSTVTVPLIFHWPGRIPPLRDRAPVRLADIMPTVLDLLGVSVSGKIDGCSLAPVIVGRDTVVAEPAYIETHLPWIYYGWAPLEGVRTSRWKFIDAPKPELYDLSKDTLELENLYETENAVARHLEKMLEGLRVASSTAQAAEVDGDTLAALRALGYVGSGEDAAHPVGVLADPKDRIEIRDRLQDAEDLMQRGDFGAAVGLFDAVLSIEPANRSAILRSGVALLKSGRPAAALPRLERSIELDPDRAEARFAFADALMRVGRFDDAVIGWQVAAQLQPRRYHAWFNLGVALVELDRYPEAVTAFERCRELRPEASEARVALARSSRRAGEADRAVSELLSLVEGLKQAEDFEEATELGLGLLALGRLGEAETWLTRGIESGRESAQAAIGLARIAMRQGRDHEACLLASEALNIDGTQAGTLAEDDDLSSCLD